MALSRAFCVGSQFYCYPLSTATPEDDHDIMAFKPVDAKGAGLVDYPLSSERRCLKRGLHSAR